MQSTAKQLFTILAIFLMWMHRSRCWLLCLLTTRVVTLCTQWHHVHTLWCTLCALILFFFLSAVTSAYNIITQPFFMMAADLAIVDIGSWDNTFLNSRWLKMWHVDNGSMCNSLCYITAFVWHYFGFWLHILYIELALLCPSVFIRGRIKSVHKELMSKQQTGLEFWKT